MSTVVFSPGRQGGVPAPALPQQGRRPNIIAVFAMMAVTFVLTMLLQFQPEHTGGGQVDVRKIPASMAGWRHMGDIPLDQNVNEAIKADSAIMRVYHSPQGQEVQLYLVYRRYGRREFNHNPDQCFPAGGYRLLSREVTAMPWAGENREAVHMLFDGSQVMRTDGKAGVPPTTVSYLFASGAKTEHVFLKQQLWMALERLVPNKNGWALLRITSPRVTTDEDALNAQKEFLRVYGPEIQKVITTDSAH